MLDNKQPFDRNHMTTVLDTILVAWSKDPYQRLGQLLVNAIRVNDLFYVEDTLMVEKVQAYGAHKDTRTA